MSQADFNDLFESCIALHKFGARNLDNQRGGETIQCAGWEEEVRNCKSCLELAVHHMVEANRLAAKHRKRKLRSGEQFDQSVKRVASVAAKVAQAGEGETAATGAAAAQAGG